MSKAIAGAALIGAVVGAELLTAMFDPALTVNPVFQKAMFAIAAEGVSMEAGALASALTSNRGMNITTRQAAANRQIIYGQQRVGGIQIFKSTTGSHKDQLNYVIVIAGHVCDSIVNLYLDGRQVHWAGGSGNVTRNGVNFGGAADGNSYTGPNGVQYNFGGAVYAEARFGDQTEGENGATQIMASLRANDPTWDFDVNGNNPWVAGCTYIYLKCENNPSLFPGEPEVRITVNGKNNIWDPRTQTSGFTTNWALIGADMITDTQFGLGDNTVNQLNLISAANVCDEDVEFVGAGGGTETRYSCSYHYDTGTAPGDALSAIMPGAAGSYSLIGGEHYLWPAYWQGPSFTFGAQHLTAPFSWKPYRSVPDLINCVNGTYIAPTFPYNIAGNEYDRNGFYNGEAQDNFSFAYQPTSFPQYAQDGLHGFPSDEWLTADGGHQHPLELSLQSVLSLGQAQRVAKIYLLRNRFQGMGTLEMSLGAYVMQSKSVFDFNFVALGWTNKVLEVSGANLTVAVNENSGAPEIRASFNVNETDSSIYEWSTIEELTVYDVPALPSQTPLTPAPPTNIELTSGPDTAIVQPDGSLESVIQITFDTPLDNLTVQIQVQYQIVGASTWLSAPPIDISLNVGLISGVIAGASYNVRIRSTRADGVSSDWLEVSNYMVSTTPSFLGTLGAQIPVITANSQLAGTAPGEMLVNGNFLAGVTSWSVDAGSIVISTVEFHGSTQSLQVRNQTVSQHVDVKAGRTYLLQAWVMTDGNVVVPGGFGAGIFLSVPSGNALTLIDSNSSSNHFGSTILDIELPATAATSWVQLQMAFTVSADCDMVVNLQNSIGGAASNSAWFDGVSLTDITTQSAQLGGVLASLITPISALMPAQAGADQTAAQPIVYTGSSESIVPNGSFILGNMQGWVGDGFIYGSDAFGPRIYAPNGGGDGGHSPSFAVVPGQKYRLGYKLYNGSGSGGVFARIAAQANYASNVAAIETPVNYTDFISNGSVTLTPTLYSFDWTCPAGMNYASMILYCISGSDLACQYVSCVPYAAAGQWGADVTGDNTSNDTDNVSGVPSSTIAQVVPTGFKLFINNGARSYSIQAV